MCGRFTLRTPAHRIAEAFDVPAGANLMPRYNIAPTQDIVAVRPAAEGGGRELVSLRWGLVPYWAKDPAIGNRLINARAETVADKPAFRAAFRKRRCLVVADGFYEWQKTANGTKQPWYIRLDDEAPFAIAGLWERWRAPGGETVESCTLITTEANARLAPIHGRMPVVLPAQAYDAWLDPGTVPPGTLLRSYAVDGMTAYAIGRRVNDAGNEDPACIELLG